MKRRRFDVGALGVDDTPVGYGENPGRMRSERGAVGRNDGGAALRAPRFKDAEDMRLSFGINFSGRLVRQEDRRIGGQRHGKAGARAFAA